MDKRLVQFAEANGGAFTRRDAVALSVSDNELARAVRAKDAIRLRRNVYVLGAPWRSATPDGRYRLRVKATLRALRHQGVEATASHHAVVALRGAPLWGVDLNTVDVQIAGLKRSRRSADIHRHPAEQTNAPLAPISLAAALVQVAKASGTVAATVSADHALHNGWVTPESLAAAVAADQASVRLHAWLADLDSKSESVGESRLRLILRDCGWKPRSQVVIALGTDEAGNDWNARVDFLLGERLIIEFDGLAKYGGTNGREALAAEKKREERLVRLGYKVLRIVWSELDNPAALHKRVVAMAAELAKAH